MQTLSLLSCAAQVVRKVKSMQMFHTPVSSAVQGDRLGICVTQFDPKLLERGLVCAPESLHTVHAALISVEKIPYFRGPLQTKAKFHITVGHETVMGRVMFFSPAPDSLDREPVLDSFDFSREYLFQEQYLCPGPAEADAAEATEKAGQASAGRCPRQQWALVEFEKPVTCPRLCLVIGSRLDADIHANTCRLAFHGVLLHGLGDRDYAESALPALRVYKLKQKHGVVERVSTPSCLRSSDGELGPRPLARPGRARPAHRRALQLLGPAGQRRWAAPWAAPHCQPSLQPHLGALARWALSRRQSLWLPGVESRGQGRAWWSWDRPVCADSEPPAETPVPGTQAPTGPA